MRGRTTFWAVTCLCTMWAPQARAQNWSFDARTIALGGVGSTSNIAAPAITNERPSRSIVVPLGLFQVLRDIDVFKPDSDQFDPVRAIEHAASPIHFVVGRETGSSGNRFVNDIFNAEISNDLNRYSGFVLSDDILAEGLASTTWGKTFRFAGSADGAFHGIYVGAGPYLSMSTHATLDPRLTALLASSTPVYIPNTSFNVTNASVGQMALAVAGGYRARLALPGRGGAGGPVDGIYLAANYNYLRGFRYEDMDVGLRIDTNSAGLIAANPRGGAPFVLDRQAATSGQGLAIDMGIAAVVNRWHVGFGVNGIANRIDWENVERTTYTLTSIMSGDGDFIESATQLLGQVTVELPVDYQAHAAYDAPSWGATAEWGNGFNGTRFRGGFEQRFARIELRGGGRYLRSQWEPSGGVGFNLTDTFGIDVAGFSTSANAQRKRHLAIAVSLRFRTSSL
jgi:hypothetical protein